MTTLSHASIHLDERKNAVLGSCPGPYSWCFEGLRAYEVGGNAVIFCGPAHLIFTGTPGKTQAVTHGDTIEIEGVGRLCNSVAGQRVQIG